MMKQQHVLNQIPDYVLGLLSQGQRLQVERHTLMCDDCRLALKRESELSQMVRATLTAATQPPANLRRFMPDVPRRRPFFLSHLTWQKQLFPLAMVLFLLLGSLSLTLNNRRSIWANPSPTFLAVTATMTDEPTATLTQTRTEQAILPRHTAVPADQGAPPFTVTPAPNPTPIAAAPILLTN